MSKPNLGLVLSNGTICFSLYQLANSLPFFEQDSSVGVNESPPSQEPAASSRPRRRALSPIQEEEEEEEDEKVEEKEECERADSSENSSRR